MLSCSRSIGCTSELAGRLCSARPWIVVVQATSYVRGARTFRGLRLAARQAGPASGHSTRSRPVARVRDAGPVPPGSPGLLRLSRSPLWMAVHASGATGWGLGPRRRRRRAGTALAASHPGRGHCPRPGEGQRRARPQHQPGRPSVPMFPLLVVAVCHGGDGSERGGGDAHDARAHACEVSVCARAHLRARTCARACGRVVHVDALLYRNIGLPRTSARSPKRGMAFGDENWTKRTRRRDRSTLALLRLSS